MWCCQVPWLRGMQKGGIEETQRGIWVGCKGQQDSGAIKQGGLCNSSQLCLLFKNIFLL